MTRCSAPGFLFARQRLVPTVEHAFCAPALFRAIVCRQRLAGAPYTLPSGPLPKVNGNTIYSIISDSYSRLSTACPRMLRRVGDKPMSSEFFEKISAAVTFRTGCGKGFESKRFCPFWFKSGRLNRAVTQSDSLKNC
jgi:hypothetical protein